MKKKQCTRLLESSQLPGKVKPTIPGVYKRITSQGDVTYARWDGKLWHIGIRFMPTDEGHLSAYRKATRIEGVSFTQSPRVWWGLAEEPKS